MKKAANSVDPYASLDAQQLRAMLIETQHQVQTQDQYIRILEERLRLETIRKFLSSSEKNPFQVDLFDEAELDVALSEIDAQLPEEEQVRKPHKTTCQRRFAEKIPRVRIELPLDKADKVGAERTFFSKVKEELDYIPAKVQVLEYWQEKAVFAQDDGTDRMISASRPIHPLGKCTASTTLLAYILCAKYVDGLPLYRLESVFKRHGTDVNRSTMSHWVVRLGTILKPLVEHIRTTQLTASYLQADETRLQVLKEPGKTAQSEKWMWVIRGGPPDKMAVLFEYDPTRAGKVAKRLLDGFNGVLQCDGYSGYAPVCDQNKLTRIGCMDHARRKFVEASRAAETPKRKSKKGQPSKADVALSQIRKLYRIEAKVNDKTPEERYQVRQELALPILNDLKAWLEKNHTRLYKDSLTYKAVSYMLNQWNFLIGYCDDGILNISNAGAENAI